jgi:hypothetical protein
MVAAKRASRAITATPLRVKSVAIVTFVASFPFVVCVSLPTPLPGVSLLTPSWQNLGDG